MCTIKEEKIELYFDMQFDARGLKCPLAFVKAKLALLNEKKRIFLFDDQISHSNFIHYLAKKNIRFRTQVEINIFKVWILE